MTAPDDLTATMRAIWEAAADAPDRPWTAFDSQVAEQDPHSPWAGDRDADFEALVSENRSERQAERALEFTEWGGR